MAKVQGHQGVGGGSRPREDGQDARGARGRVPPSTEAGRAPSGRRWPSPAEADARAGEKVRNVAMDALKDQFQQPSRAAPQVAGARHPETIPSRRWRALSEGPRRVPLVGPRLVRKPWVTAEGAERAQPPVALTTTLARAQPWGRRTHFLPTSSEHATETFSSRFLLFPHRPNDSSVTFSRAPRSSLTARSVASVGLSGDLSLRRL